jgi:hypothetical protein
MTEVQATEIIGKLDSLLEHLAIVIAWLEQLTSWVVIHVGLIVPGVIVLGLMYWALSQFVNRYY